MPLLATFRVSRSTLRFNAMIRRSTPSRCRIEWNSELCVDTRELAQSLTATRQPGPIVPIGMPQATAISSHFARVRPTRRTVPLLLFGQQLDRSFQFAQLQLLNLVGRAGQRGCTLVPFGGRPFRGSPTDLADILIVQDAE